MNIVMMLAFASIAACGNAMFALGQKRSSDIECGLSVVAASALIAFLLAALASPISGAVDMHELVRHWKPVVMSGVGLFVTYLGFNLLYTRFGTSPYAVYAVLSIVTTTVGIGIVYLKAQ